MRYDIVRRCLKVKALDMIMIRVLILIVVG